MSFFRNPMALRLGTGNQAQMQLTPNPERSIYIQQLMARALQNNGRGSRSVAESLDIASAPIVAALMGRMQGKQQQAQQAQQTELANSLLSQTLRKNIQLENLDGQAPDTFSVPANSPVDPKQRALAQVLAQNPQAMSALAMQQVMPQGGEGFTLGPGQVRFGSNNQPVAAVPTAPAEGDNKPLSPAGKIMADVKSGNLQPETGKALLDVDLKRDPLTIGNAEESLRKEYNQNLSGITTALTSLGNARKLLETGNPIGVQASLTAFVRAIDNSVVRPSELEQYQNISGVARNLENKLGELAGKGPFSEETKKQIMDSIDALAATSQDIRKGATKYYGKIARDRKLSAENVTGFTFGPKDFEPIINPQAGPPAAPAPVGGGQVQRVIR